MQTLEPARFRKSGWLLRPSRRLCTECGKERSHTASAILTSIADTHPSILLYSATAAEGSAAVPPSGQPWVDQVCWAASRACNMGRAGEGNQGCGHKVAYVTQLRSSWNCCSLHPPVANSNDADSNDHADHCCSSSVTLVDGLWTGGLPAWTGPHVLQLPWCGARPAGRWMRCTAASRPARQ
jgi:hypothetical protein